jgi:hypothetical protein
MKWFKKLPSPSKLVEVLYAIVELTRYFLEKKKEHDAKEAVDKAVENGDQAYVEKEFNGDSKITYRPTRSSLSSVVRTRPAKNRKAD